MKSPHFVMVGASRREWSPHRALCAYEHVRASGTRHSGSEQCLRNKRTTPALFAGKTLPHIQHYVRHASCY
ncbi:unnamed protein product, partial [Iphiclides podalirius]